jgi:hypothetical protein
MPIEVTLPASRSSTPVSTVPTKTHVWRKPPAKPVMGFIDNTKTRAADLMNAVGRELKRRGVIDSHFVHQKPDAAHSIPPDVRADLMARGHVFVSGIGD